MLHELNIKSTSVMREALSAPATGSYTIHSRTPTDVLSLLVIAVFEKKRIIHVRRDGYRQRRDRESDRNKPFFFLLLLFRGPDILNESRTFSAYCGYRMYIFPPLKTDVADPTALYYIIVFQSVEKKTDGPFTHFTRSSHIDNSRSSPHKFCFPVLAIFIASHYIR